MGDPLTNKPKAKPLWPIVTIFAAAFILVVVIWTSMEPGGWPIDFRILASLVVLGILTGSSQACD